MAPVKVTMEVGTDGVAVITIFNPPVNALAIPSKLIRFSPNFNSCVWIGF